MRTVQPPTARANPHRVLFKVRQARHSFVVVIVVIDLNLATCFFPSSGQQFQRQSTLSAKTTNSNKLLLLLLFLLSLAREKSSFIIVFLYIIFKCNAMIDYLEKQQISNQQMQLINYNPNQNQHSTMSMYEQQQQAQLIQRQQTSQEIPIQQSGNNELIGYYFGSISRETAEWILRNHGKRLNGSYLLRSSGPNDDFVLSLMVAHKSIESSQQQLQSTQTDSLNLLEVLHYKIVETEDSFVALHGQVGDEKFATIDELIDKAQGVATKPRWPIMRTTLESQILPPTYWGLSVDQVRLAILIKAKQWGFPMLSSLFQSPHQQLDASQMQQQLATLAQSSVLESSSGSAAATTLNNETIRTLIYKSLHEFQPWFHGKISRDEAEKRIEETTLRDGRFLVRERDNYSYAMCISHKKTTKHYRIDVLPTGELAIQDGRKFTSLMALVSHYTIMSDGLWCALTEPCPRPIQANSMNSKCFAPGAKLAAAANAMHAASNAQIQPMHYDSIMGAKLHCNNLQQVNNTMRRFNALPNIDNKLEPINGRAANCHSETSTRTATGTDLVCANQSGIAAIKMPIKEWLQTINHKWSQLLASKSQHHQSLNSFLFGAQNPLNNHCHRHSHRSHDRSNRRKCKNGHFSCSCSYPTSQAQMNLPAANCLMHPNANQIPVNSAALRPINRCQDGISRANACCTLWPASRKQMIAANQMNQTQPAPFNVADQAASLVGGNSMLSYCPPNSGFTMNGASFIGSPLFAVKQVTREKHQSTPASSNSSGSYGNQMAEDKLISPAQSISGNLSNNPYNINTDIYWSDTSTAIVKDQPQPTTSSSSSSAANFASFQHPSVMQNNSNQLNQIQYQPRKLSQQIPSAKLQPQITQAGPIMCGQHAGPAYRYTNCNDENLFRLCQHRPAAHQRAADDSHLISSNSQVVGPAAMSKFVQFQDGQCLRTHRDTRSIQMAYLLSRQQNANTNRNNQNVPLREINSHEIQQNGSNLFAANNFNAHQAKNNKIRIKPNFSNSNESRSNFIASSNDNKANDIDQNGNLNDIDLMDCGDDGTFKYDPKLIKSSSIETLCGVGDEENSLDQCQSNSQLIASLQSYWQPNLNILNPVQVNETRPDECNFSTNCQANEHETDSSTLLSSLMNGNQNETQYDQMKKKNDLDELTTALLAELTASLKAQVDLKNKRSGLGLHSNDKSESENQQTTQQEANKMKNADNNSANPMELVNEFDTLIQSNRY